MSDQPGPTRVHIDSCDCSDCTAPPLRNQLAYALADNDSVWLHQEVVVRLADRLLPVVEAALDRSNRLAFQAGWNHATVGWEQRAAVDDVCPNGQHTCCPNGQHTCCCKADQ